MEGNREMLDYLRWLKRTCKNYKEIVDMAEKDIKFNRIGFGKKTTPEQFILICQRCHTAMLKA